MDSSTNILFLSIISAFLGHAVSVGYLLLAIFRFDAIRRHWRDGAKMGVVVFLLLLPGVILSMVFFDPSAMLSEPGQGIPKFLEGIMQGALVLGLGVAVVKIAWHGVLYCLAVTQWRTYRGEPPALPGERRSIAWQPLLACLAFGMGMGIITVFVFSALGIREGDLVTLLQSVFPGQEDTPLALRLPIWLLSVSGAAVAEELTYRGGLLAYALRKCGKNRVLAGIVILLVSLLWAFLHAANTNFPVVKILQIFIFSLFLCGFAMRWGIGTAIAAHVGLNLSAVILQLFIPLS